MFYFLAISSIFTGLFKPFIILYSIILVHELGHGIIAYNLNWNISKINIYPFGGYTLFGSSINKNIKEELSVLLFGPLFQLIFYLFITYLYKTNLINISTFYIFKNYHYMTLIFNLIPIYPLDGSKILNIILNRLLPFKISHVITLYISYTLVIIILLINIKINMILISMVLLFKIIEEHKNHNFIFNKFLIERYIRSMSNYTKNIINGNKINKMKKYKNNVFLINNKNYDELDILISRFNSK